MTDALAADRLLGESTREMFAFGSYSKNKKIEVAEEWKAKNVTPILYREFRKHAHLHSTLKKWAEVHNHGVSGKEQIIVEAATSGPMVSTKQEDFVGRLLWAISEPTGLPAKRFAEINPVPPLDWIKPLSEGRHGHADLQRFGITPRHPIDSELLFSIVSRPLPYHLAPRMCLVDSVVRGGQWDKVMQQLARWILRHLGDPELLLWFVSCGGEIQEGMVREIEGRLGEIDRLQREEKTEELDEIKANSSNAIPSPRMMILWGLFLSGRVKTQKYCSVYQWRERFTREGLTTSVRMALRTVLAPVVVVSRTNSALGTMFGSTVPDSAEDKIRCEIGIFSDDAYSAFGDISKLESWRFALPELMVEFGLLLRDALDLERELSHTGNDCDYSYIYRPSIGASSENQDLSDWTVLVDLARDAWLAAAEAHPENAALEAEVWMLSPHPLFKRLAFFAAASGKAISRRRALDWLLGDECRWLWAVEIQEESISLIAALAPEISSDMLSELVDQILEGPPRSVFIENAGDEELARERDRFIWLRLAKISESGAKLVDQAEYRLTYISRKYPTWKLVDDQRDRILAWVDDDESAVVRSPRRRKELVVWLKLHPASNRRERDDWRQRCEDNFPTTVCALGFLASEEAWPADRWREALQIWSEERFLRRSWRYMAPVLCKAPDNVLLSLSHDVSRWLSKVAKVFEGNEPRFFEFAKRILSLKTKEGVSGGEPINQAINHPVGIVAEALLHWWYRRDLNDDDGLSVEIKPLFSEIADSLIGRFRHGRVILAAHVITLFRVDPGWTNQHLLPHFSWEKSEEEASAVWQGFLWSPRLYYPLLDAVKSDFLAVASRYGSLGKAARQYASLLTFSALNLGGSFTRIEISRATRSLPSEGMSDSVDALVRALETASDEHSGYWVDQVEPYLSTVWPQTNSARSEKISEKFGRLCISAKDEFPRAFETLKKWLVPPKYNRNVSTCFVPVRQKLNYFFARLSVAKFTGPERSCLPCSSITGLISTTDGGAVAFGAPLTKRLRCCWCCLSSTCWRSAFKGRHSPVKT